MTRSVSKRPWRTRVDWLEERLTRTRSRHPPNNRRRASEGHDHPLSAERRWPPLHAGAAVDRGRSRSSNSCSSCSCSLSHRSCSLSYRSCSLGRRSCCSPGCRDHCLGRRSRSLTIQAGDSTAALGYRISRRRPRSPDSSPESPPAVRRVPADRRMTTDRFDRVDQRARLSVPLPEQPDDLLARVARSLARRARSDRDARGHRLPPMEDPRFEQEQQHVIDDLMRIRIGTPLRVEQFDGDYFEYRSESSGND